MRIKGVHFDRGYKVGVLAFVALNFCFALLILSARGDPNQQVRQALIGAFDKALGLPGIDEGSWLGSGKRTLRSLLRIIPTALEGQYPAAVPGLHLHLNFENLRKMKAERKNAIAAGALRDRSFYPAKIEYAGLTLRARIRLKGDFADHWSTPDRWSLRVQLSKGSTIFGMNQFSLHKPTSRQIPDDMLFQRWIRTAGNLAPRHEFVNLHFNGDNWGVMNMEEHMSSMFLEISGRRAAPIFKLVESDKWSGMLSPNSAQHKMPTYPLRHMAQYNRRIYKDDDAQKALFKYAEQAYENYLLGNFPLEKLIDIDAFSRVLISTIVWGSTHTASLANMRFYLNPLNLRIEPITTDQQARGRPGLDLRKFIPRGFPFHALLTSRIFHERLSNNLMSLRTGLPAVRQEYRKICRVFPLDCPEFDMANLVARLKAFEDQKTNIFDKIKASSATPFVNDDNENPATAYHTHIHAGYYDSGQVHFVNLLDSDVEIIGIRQKCTESNQCDPTQLLPGPKTLKTSLGPNQRTRLKINFPAGLNLGSNHLIEITTRSGQDERRTQLNRTLRGNLWPFEETHDEHPFLQITPEEVVVPPGDWILDTPLVIGSNRLLRFTSGTTISFAANAYILSRSPIVIQGTQKQPVRLKPLTGAGWPGIFVLEAGRESVFKNAEINGTTAKGFKNLSLTGGTTFYKSPAHFENVVFSNIYSEDAVNFVASPFRVTKSAFHDTRSDAIDSDFSDGTLSNLFFEKIGGDGLDSSGSFVVGSNLKFRSIGDKAISVGEASKVDISTVDIDGAVAGVVSKDGSVLRVRDLVSKNTILFAGMSYIKKAAYGKAILRVENTKLPQQDFFNQRGNELLIDGIELLGCPLDVKYLYDKGPMRKDGSNEAYRTGGHALRGKVCSQSGRIQ